MRKLVHGTNERFYKFKRCWWQKFSFFSYVIIQWNLFFVFMAQKWQNPSWRAACTCTCTCTSSSSFVISTTFCRNSFLIHYRCWSHDVAVACLGTEHTFVHTLTGSCFHATPEYNCMETWNRAEISCEGTKIYRGLTSVSWNSMCASFVIRTLGSQASIKFMVYLLDSPKLLVLKYPFLNGILKTSWLDPVKSCLSTCMSNLHDLSTSTCQTHRTRPFKLKVSIGMASCRIVVVDLHSEFYVILWLERHALELSIWYIIGSVACKNRLGQRLFANNY